MSSISGEKSGLPSSVTGSYSQEKRPLAIDTPLGKDVLLLTGFKGKERMSRLFHFELECTSTKDDLDATAIVGKAVTFHILRADGQKRYFHGHVSRFGFHGRNDRGLSLYTVEVVPWLWFLTQTSDCRIFQGQTVPQIIEQVFKEMGFNNFHISAKGQHPEREYCVQYRETDFDFISRLLEEEGMYYYFQHEQGKHTLMISDHRGGYTKIDEGTIGMGSVLGGLQLPDNITKWERRFQFCPGKIAHRDFNYHTPSMDMEAKDQSGMKLPLAQKYEVYDYPGLYDHKGMGTELAKSRQQALDERFDTGSGAGTCRTFSPGHSFSMDRHHAASEKGKQWVLLEVEHDMMDGASYLTQRDPKDLKGYRNTFTCMPSDRAHRPARETLKPAVRGCQTAVVVGPQGPHYKAGHEVHVDDLGRVKVRFHWDRYAKDDDNSSCWIRVSQAWAGPGMGGMVIPRIGQEVIVDFLEGDPDRPIIIGRVYNAEAPPNASTVGADEMKRMREKSSSVNKQASAASKPPDKHAPDDDAPEEPGVKPSPVSAAERGSSVLAAAKASLPTGLADLAKRKADNKEPPKAAGISAAFHTTSFKSESLNGGGGSNEISMNDAGGSEAMFFRAQKDEVHTVGNDQSHAVANDQMVEIGNNKTQTIGNNETKSVATNQTTTVGSNQSNTVGANKTEKVALMSNEMVGVSKTTTVGAAYAVTVGAVHTVTVGGMMNTAVGFMSKEQVGVSKTVNVGSNIEIVCGSSKLTMDSAGNIVLEGVNITIKGSSTIKYESGGTFDLKSAGAMSVTSDSILSVTSKETTVVNSGNSIVANATQAVAVSAGASMALVASSGTTINGGAFVDVDGGVIDLN